MGALTAGPCTPWVPLGCTALDISAAAITGDLLDAATFILWSKSGRQFDVCSTTFRPCRRDCYGEPFWSDLSGGQWPNPALVQGQWLNLGCGGCPGACSCTTLEQVLLPWPTSAVTEIKIDGTVLTPVADHAVVYDYRFLVRTDGGTWPLCNDLSKPDTEDGTWSITVTAGTPVPKMGQLAVGELLQQLVNACTGAPCQLPPNVSQIVRQGVSLTLLDPDTVFAAGRLGLRLCDLFLSTVNPQGIQDRARVYDPSSLSPWRAT